MAKYNLMPSISINHAQADGVSTNVVDIMCLDDQYLPARGVELLFKVDGSTQIAGTIGNIHREFTDGNGVAHLKLTDKVAETVAFVVKNDGAFADGKASNSITFTLQDSETGEALRNTRLVCIIKGQAIFTENKATLYSATTNNEGEVTVHLVSEVERLISVSCFLASSPANVLNADVCFVKPLEVFKINEIKTLNHTLYYGEPSIVWTGASFLITTRGGSGEVS